MNAFPQLKTKGFTAWIADNRSLGVHAAGYNGVASLVPHCSGNNLFVPSLSGMNCEMVSLAGLEHYQHPSGNPMEPRCAPMHIESADRESVVLFQPEMSHSHVSIRTTFRVAEPHYLHKRIEVTAHRRFCGPDERNRLILLCANYMLWAPDRHVYVQTDNATDALAGWVGLTQEHHGAPTLQVYHMPSDREIDASEHMEFIAGSLSAHEQWPRKSDRPLSHFYGFCHDDQMFLMMFKQSDRVRLTYSPHGGGLHPIWSPAWDYVLCEEDAVVGKTYTWDMCLAIKPFGGRRDVLDEIRRYMGN